MIADWRQSTLSGAQISTVDRAAITGFIKGVLAGEEFVPSE